MSQHKLISITAASFGYKKTGQEIAVLNNVDLNFYSGDFVGIVGLNGVGKSTFLKSVCGLLPLLKGDVSIDDQSVFSLSLSELAKKIAIVLTEKIGGFNLTAYDVVASGQMPYTNAFNKLEECNKQIINAAIETCGIKLHQHKLLNELSDGLFQKTIIGKALAQQTQIILLDEPSAFLDYASKHDLFLLLKNLCGLENKCVLVSSHDLDLLLKYCNKLLIISEDSVEYIKVTEAKNNACFMKISGGFL